jgi:hypothetical protein
MVAIDFRRRDFQNSKSVTVCHSGIRLEGKAAENEKRKRPLSVDSSSLDSPFDSI